MLPLIRMGKSIPDKIYNDKEDAGVRMGLNLPRGPDPRYSCYSFAS
jgi:hypothetical protein